MPPFEFAEPEERLSFVVASAPGEVSAPPLVEWLSLASQVLRVPPTGRAPEPVAADRTFLSAAAELRLRRESWLTAQADFV